MIDLARFVSAPGLIVVPHGTAEPMTLTRALVGQRSALSGCRVLLGAVFSDTFQAAARDRHLVSYGGIGRTGALVDAGACEVIPCVPFSSAVSSLCRALVSQSWEVVEPEVALRGVPPLLRP